MANKLFLLALLLLLSVSAQADRGRLNRFDELVVTGVGLFADGSDNAPSITFQSDVDTGLRRASSGIITFECNTTNCLSIYNGGLQTVVGSSTAPSYSFDGDGDTGFSSPTANAINVIAGGSTVATFDSGGLNITGEVSITGLPTASGVICRKADGDLGQCTSAVASGGTCTCG